MTQFLNFALINNIIILVTSVSSLLYLPWSTFVAQIEQYDNNGIIFCRNDLRTRDSTQFSALLDVVGRQACNMGADTPA